MGHAEQIESILEVIRSNSRVGQAMAQVQKLGLDRDERRKVNKRFLHSLTKLLNDKATAIIWLKTNFENETASQVIEDHEHTDTMMADWLEDNVEAAKKAWGSLNMCQDSGKTKFNINWSGFILRFIKIFISYLDLTKDTILAGLLIHILGNSLFTDITAFPSQVTWILLASIVLPLLGSAVETAYLRPQVTVLKQEREYRNWTG